MKQDTASVLDHADCGRGGDALTCMSFAKLLSPACNLNFVIVLSVVNRLTSALEVSTASTVYTGQL